MFTQLKLPLNQYDLKNAFGCNILAPNVGHVCKLNYLNKILNTYLNVQTCLSLSLRLNRAAHIHAYQRKCSPVSLSNGTILRFRLALAILDLLSTQNW